MVNEGAGNNRPIGKEITRWMDDEDELVWQSMVEDITEAMKGKTEWRAEVENFGWRSLSGYAEFHAENGQGLLNRTLPKTDCHFIVYRYKRSGLAIRNWHHDSPMGREWYYILPKKGGK